MPTWSAFSGMPQNRRRRASVLADHVLGYIEALRLRNEVRCPLDSTLVAQVVVDGQPVDFGESLFVVDTTALAVAELPPEEAPLPVPPIVETAEPPRL